MTAPDERTSDTTTSLGGHYCDCDLTDARRRLAARSPPLGPKKIKRNAVSWLVRDEEKDLGGGCAHQIGRGRGRGKYGCMHISGTISYSVWARRGFPSSCSGDISAQNKELWVAQVLGAISDLKATNLGLTSRSRKQRGLPRLRVI